MTVLPSHTTESEKKIWSLLASVSDPEVPVLSVIDLGIIRDVTIERTGDAHDKPVITITPTYSGCPAMDVISINIRMVLLQAGFREVVIKQALSPAWTTDWMSPEGKDKLKAYGIAPPQYRKTAYSSDAFQEEVIVPCPQCNSTHTTLVSQFGSTACKALYKCEDCKEPFDYFKCH